MVGKVSRGDVLPKVAHLRCRVTAILFDWRRRRQTQFGPRTKQQMVERGRSGIPKIRERQKTEFLYSQSLQNEIRE